MLIADNLGVVTFKLINVRNLVLQDLAESLLISSDDKAN